MERTASDRILPMLIAATMLACPYPLHAANGLTVLHYFDDVVHGANPFGRLVEGSDGTFYGTTQSGGGLDGFGEVYRVDAGGNFSIVHSFVKGPDGYQPDSGLVLMDDGNFYGTTRQSCQGSPCTYTGGTVFRMAPDGTLTTVHAFTGADDKAWPGPLTASRDGLLYGLTYHGGSDIFGSAYAISTDATYIPLADFNRANGSNPDGALIEGADGSFYGTTSSGGTYDKGTVFRMTQDGAITTLHDFTGGDDGSGPNGDLLQGDDGRFYGGTAHDGRGGRGTVFAITADGALTTLHAFNGGDGTGPIGALVQGSDGYLYGASGGGLYLSHSGGSSEQGTLFRLSTSGWLMTLHLFAPEEGTSPATAPIFGSDGRLYGTTDFFGSPDGGFGSVYAFDLAAPRMPELHMCNYYGSDHKCQGSVDGRVGQIVQLDWASANVAYCQASGAWNGVRSTGGTYRFRATRPGVFRYRLDCRGPEGRIAGQIVVRVIR